MNRRFTQAALAKSLGVSQGLVSQVLNGKHEMVSDEIYDRIWAEAKAVGYQPRGMVPQAARPSRVGFLMRPGVDLGSQNSFFGGIQEGILAAITQRGGSDLLYLGSADQFDVQRLPLDLTAVAILGGVDAAIVQTLTARGLRVISVLAAWPGLCSSLQCDERRAMELLVSRLRTRGHTRFAYLGGNVQRDTGRRRLEAIRDLLSPTELAGVFTATEAKISTGQNLAAETLKAELSASAWICGSSCVARGAAHELWNHRGSIARFPALVSGDRGREAEDGLPAITCAGTAPYEIGRQAGMMALADDFSHRDLLTPVELVAGQADDAGWNLTVSR
jgi:DNA-binding LacI/PurR family transcriptional regulator